MTGRRVSKNLDNIPVTFLSRKERMAHLRDAMIWNAVHEVAPIRVDIRSRLMRTASLVPAVASVYKHIKKPTGHFQIFAMPDGRMVALTPDSIAKGMPEQAGINAVDLDKLDDDGNEKITHQRLDPQEKYVHPDDPGTPNGKT